MNTYVRSFMKVKSVLINTGLDFQRKIVRSRGSYMSVNILLNLLNEVI